MRKIATPRTQKPIWTKNYLASFAILIQQRHEMKNSPQNSVVIANGAIVGIIVVVVVVIVVVGIARIATVVVDMKVSRPQIFIFKIGQDEIFYPSLLIL